MTVVTTTSTTITIMYTTRKQPNIG